MRRLSFLLLSSGVAATPASAQGIAITPIFDARLRYERVEQAPLPDDANAVTARIRSGLEAKIGDFALLAESEAVLAIGGAYNDGLNGKTRYPIVPDPQNVELNRLQVQYRGLKKTVVTVGRQRIDLDDQRFVGSVGWRDNEQTFDAARVEYTGIANLKADLTYARSDRTIWGVDGGNRFGPARYTAIRGDTVFANVSYTTKFAKLTGFAYLIDRDAPLVLRESNQTYGARLTGAYPVAAQIRLTYLASYARQSDYRFNPNRYSADYIAAEIGAEAKALKLIAGYERLGADDGVALTSFQTPLATLHKFNGWADKFLVTPPDGLRDVYGSVGYGWKKVGPFDAIGVVAVYHRFDATRASTHYGNEIDAQVTAKRGRYAGLIKFADYDADRFATDTRKIWVSLEYTL